jgi:hypothetical protein
MAFITGGHGMIDWDVIKSKTFLPPDRPLRLFPIAAELEGYEVKSGFALPRSFREFATTFGAGTIEPGDWRFAVPGIPDPFGGRYTDPTSLTRWFMQGREGTLADEYDDTVRARRLVLFCSNESYDFFGWDPLDVTEPESHEYGIYLLGRYDTRVLRLAKRFRRFVLDYCFRGTIGMDEDAADSEGCVYVDYLVTMGSETDEDEPLGFYPSIHHETDGEARGD